jgi:hypothetical protein
MGGTMLPGCHDLSPPPLLMMLLPLPLPLPVPLSLPLRPRLADAQGVRGAKRQAAGGRRNPHLKIPR